jgi:RNA polymerase sigma-70 factor (sigma-E family)
MLYLGKPVIDGGRARREFEAFVRATGADLVRTAYLLTGDMGKAEDLAQETFLRLARHWDRARTVEYPSAYARRALVNLVLDSSTKRSRQSQELGSGDELDTHADGSADRALSAIEDAAGFRSAVLQLPRRQQVILMLRYLYDLPEREVADVLGCSVGTVSSTASRAAARLAQVLRAEGAADQEDAGPPGPSTPPPGAGTTHLPIPPTGHRPPPRTEKALTC